MNAYESSLLEEYLLANGFHSSMKIEEANFILINTCVVREKSAFKALSFLGKVKKLKEKRPDLIVCLFGCMSPLYEEELRKNSAIDRIFGPLNSNFVPLEFENLIHKVKNNKKDKEIQRRVLSRYITIIFGCDSFCSYCIVPYVRGREKSVSFEEVLSKVRNYASMGTKEVTLLGQNVDHYGVDLPENVTFAKLLKAVAKIDGINRIDFMTSHPKEFDTEIIDIIGESEKIYRHFHLPIQSGDDRILELMNRRYRSSEYFELVEKIRDSFPLASLTTDLIVGFPSEDEKAFLNTVNLVKKIKFDTIYVASYSRRPKTKALTIGEEVEPCEKRRRLNYLLNLQREISLSQAKRFLETEESVFITAKSGKNYSSGKNLEEREVLFDTDESLEAGDIVKVKILDCNKTKLIGKIVG